MSPKNKGKFGKGKPTIETEDEFISTMGRLSKALEPHAKKIVIGAAAITLFLAAYFGYQWWDARKEAAATTIYTRAMVLANVVVIPSFADNSDEPPENTPENTTVNVFIPEDKNDDLLPDSYPSRAERAKAVIAALDDFSSSICFAVIICSDYHSTDVAKSANLLYGTMLYDLGKFQESFDAYESFVSHTSSDQLGLAGREGMGAASEALALAIEDATQRNAALDRTLEIYRSIQDEERARGWDHVLYHTARIQTAQGKLDEARMTLEKALEDIEAMNADKNTASSVIQDDVEQRLAQLQALQ